MSTAERLGAGGAEFEGATRVDGSIDPIMAQRGEKSQGLPMAVRNLGAQPFALAAPAVGARHVGLGPGLVDENEAPGINATLIAPPLCPSTGYVAPFLLAGQHAFF